MKRKAFLSLAVIALLAGITIAAIKAVTLRYYNKDSQTYVFDVKISGSSAKVEFGSSRTASVTIQGGSTTAIISTKCGDIEVENGDNIEIKDGCISVK